MIVRIVAQIRYLTVYRCVGCGALQRGGTDGTSLDCSSIEELKSALNRLPQRASRMPVGWANHYGVGFTCQGCNERRKSA